MNVPFVILTPSEKAAARQLGISEADALRAKDHAERARIRDLMARRRQPAAVVLTPTEVALGKRLGVSVKDLWKAKRARARR